MKQQIKSHKSNEARQARAEMDFVSLLEPVPIKFDLSTDEAHPDKSHFEYVFWYAYILYSELNADCDKEIKIEVEREKAKEIMTHLLEHQKSDHTSTHTPATHDDDDEEEIIGQGNDEEEKIGGEEIPIFENVDVQADFIDRLTDLRRIIKAHPDSFRLIK